MELKAYDSIIEVNNLVSTWDELKNLVSSGEKSICIYGNLGFDIPSVYEYCAKNNIELSAVANYIVEDNTSYKGFYINPNYIFLVEDYLKELIIIGKGNFKPYEERKYDKWLRDLVFNYQLPFKGEEPIGLSYARRIYCKKDCAHCNELCRWIIKK